MLALPVADLCAFKPKSAAPKGSAEDQPLSKFSGSSSSPARPCGGVGGVGMFDIFGFFYSSMPPHLVMTLVATACRPRWWRCGPCRGT